MFNFTLGIICFISNLVLSYLIVHVFFGKHGHKTFQVIIIYLTKTPVVMSSTSSTPLGNSVAQGASSLAPPPPQYYQSQQMRYSNPMSVPSPAQSSAMLPMQQQQPIVPPYQSINSPMQSVSQSSGYQQNLNSPRTSQLQQHIQSPLMPQSQHIYSPMANNQINSNINSPVTHSSQYQINSPMPNQSPITSTSQSHYQSMSLNSPLPPLTPQQQYHQSHQQMHHSSSSIPSTPTMMVNSPYNSYNQYNHSYQTHDQFNTSNSYQHQNSQSYDLNFDNSDYYNQQYMLKQQQQQQQQISEREREQQRERELKEKEYNEKQQRKRFLVELEFVQCLANPNYLHYLAKQGLFDNESFKNYLKYLLYWKKPEYIQFIRYPECLFFLELIQHDELQQMIKDKNCVHFICEQQMLHWKYNHESFMKTVKAMVSELNEEQTESVDDQETAALAAESKTTGMKTKSSSGAKPSMVSPGVKQKS